MNTLDAKLKKILFSIYWKSGGGWKLNPDLPSKDDFQKLIDAGVAAYPEELTHDEVLERYWEIYPQVNIEKLIKRFLASFSKRQLNYRADLLAYLEVPEKIEKHKHKGKGFCAYCGVPDVHLYDMTANQFKRYKFGTGNMFSLMDNIYMLQSTLNEEVVEPTNEDIQILRNIISTFKTLPSDAGAQELKQELKGVFKSNDEERRNLIEAFGEMDILSPSDTSEEAYSKVPTRSNWFGPVSVWKAIDGINERSLSKWFGEYLR